MVFAQRVQRRLPLRALPHDPGGLVDVVGEAVQDQERDPITGLNDDDEVLGFNRLLYGTPALVARLSRFTDRSTQALAEALREAVGSDDLLSRLAAGQIVTVQRLLAMENYERLAAGESARKRYPAAVEDAERAFELLGSGLAAHCG